MNLVCNFCVDGALKLDTYTGTLAAMTSTLIAARAPQDFSLVKGLYVFSGLVSISLEAIRKTDLRLE